MNRHVNITVTGIVQGVGFRYSALRIANKYGISGFIKNRYDGSVYIEAEADEIQLKYFIDWCKQGPRWSTVEDVKIEFAELKNYKLFKII